MQPNPHSHVNSDHLSYFQFAGRLIGTLDVIHQYCMITPINGTTSILIAMALLHEEVLEVSFTRGFYKHLLGRPVELDDLLSLDPEFHK